LHKCREHKWVHLLNLCVYNIHELIVYKSRFLAREFKFDEDAVQKQAEEMTQAEAEEKELWVRMLILSCDFLLVLIIAVIDQTDLLRLSRTNFSEAYQLLVHLKVVRLFVESVLRYGLPADYSAIVISVSQILGRLIVDRY
jgi:V-type H+-transporting ATPase subunit C